MAKHLAIRVLGVAIILAVTSIFSRVHAGEVADEEDVGKPDNLSDILERIVTLTDSISGIDARISDNLKIQTRELMQRQDKFIKEQSVTMKQLLDDVERLDAKLTVIQIRFTEDNEESKKSLDLQIEKGVMIQEALDVLGREAKDSETRVLESQQSALSDTADRIISQSNQTMGSESAKILLSIQSISDTLVAAIEESRTIAKTANQELEQGFAAHADKVSNGAVKSAVFLACLILAVTGLLVYFMLKERGGRPALVKPFPSATKDGTDKSDVEVPLEEVESEPSKDVITAEPDHSVAILLVQEVHKMKSRVDSILDDNKAKKPLQKALERLESGLADNGYEIVNHEGTKYNDGMSVKASFIPTEDENIEEYTIIRVIKPQLNYQGKSISPAEIEVSTRI